MGPYSPLRDGASRSHPCRHRCDRPRLSVKDRRLELHAVAADPVANERLTCLRAALSEKIPGRMCSFVSTTS